MTHRDLLQEYRTSRGDKIEKLLFEAFIPQHKIEPIMVQIRKLLSTPLMTSSTDYLQEQTPMKHYLHCADKDTCPACLWFEGRGPRPPGI